MSWCNASVNPFAFNSIKVRLKHTRDGRSRNLASPFNSIKVRLKPEAIQLRKVCTFFQFHKGAIETNTSSTTSVRGAIFQFHKGAIETSVHRRWNNYRSRFQFHKGAIETKFSTVTASSVKTFNSIKVRLKLVSWLAVVLPPFLSIP